MPPAYHFPFLVHDQQGLPRGQVLQCHFTDADTANNGHSAALPLWGRVTTRGLMRHWTQTFPAAVSGFLPGRSAETLLYALQHRLELIHENQTEDSLGGLTLDLVKCYNLLPRFPCRQALLRLQVPQQIVDVWYESLQSLQRWWAIDGHLVPCGKATTGVPEGDSWSVMAMLALNRIFAHHVSTDSVQVNAFADNWAYFTDCPEDHPRAIEHTWQITQSLRLEIDWKKTWGWGTSQQHLGRLKHATRRIQPDLQLQMAANARELGYILHYRQRQFRGTQKKRHEQARAQLKKLSYKGYDVVTVAQLAQQAALPKAYFGIHF